MYAEYMRIVIISDKIIYLQSQHAVFVAVSFLLQMLPSCVRASVSHYIIMFSLRIGGEVFKRAFMQHCNSIKINTNEMLTSMAAGACGGMAHYAQPPPHPRFQERHWCSQRQKKYSSNNPLHAQ